MKPLVIYHADCTDGFAAAFAAWLKLGDEAEYLPMQYGSVRTIDDFPRSPKGDRPSYDYREVYILDFSFPREVMDDIFAYAKRVVWLDHHATSKFDALSRTEESHNANRLVETKMPSAWLHVVRHSDDKSGALLAWEYFHPGTEVPMLIQHIDDRDRWQFKLEGSKELHAALASMKPWSFEQWNSIGAVYLTPFHKIEQTVAPESEYDILIDQGAAILRAQDAHIKSMLKQARKCSINTLHVTDDYSQGSYFRGLALNTPSHMSEVGHELANQSGTFGLVWYLDSGGRVKCSLRSNGEYDVSAIARAFGGGGHHNAAGFETDIDTLMGWLK